MSSQDSENDGFFAGFRALENETNSNNSSDSEKSENEDISEKSPIKKPAKFLPDSSQSDEENIPPIKNLNNSTADEFDDSQTISKNLYHRTEKHYINHLKSLKCADTEI